MALGFDGATSWEPAAFAAAGSSGDVSGRTGYSAQARRSAAEVEKTKASDTGCCTDPSRVRWTIRPSAHRVRRHARVARIPKRWVSVDVQDVRESGHARRSSSPNAQRAPFGTRRCFRACPSRAPEVHSGDQPTRFRYRVLQYSVLQLQFKLRGTPATSRSCDASPPRTAGRSDTARARRG